MLILDKTVLLNILRSDGVTLRNTAIIVEIYFQALFKIPFINDSPFWSILCEEFAMWFKMASALCKCSHKADAILERPVHTEHRINIKGESMCKKQRNKH